MRIFIFIMLFLLTIGCGKSQDRRTQGDITGPDVDYTEEGGNYAISLLNFDVALYSYIPGSDSKVKFRASFQNTGNKALEGATIFFKGDTCLYSFDSWTEVEMGQEDNINIEPGKIYYSAFYNGHNSFPDLWSYYIHNNCGSWKGRHYVRMKIIDAGGNILTEMQKSYTDSLPL